MGIVSPGRCATQEGDQLGNWKVIGTPFTIPGIKRHRTAYAVCECKCGTIAALVLPEARRGNPFTCGCESRYIAPYIKKAKSWYIKDPVKRRLRSIYGSMKTRCRNENAINYKHYGGRGITICEEWSTLPKFAEWALGHGYESHLTIERRDNCGGYTPDNCYWATRGQQARNKRNNRVLKAFGEEKCMSDWANDERCAVSFNGLRRRLRAGWKDEAAIKTPPGKGHR